MVARSIVAFVSVVALCALFFAGCTEPPPGEAICNVTKGRQPFGANLKALNADGEVVGSGAVIGGIGNIPGLPPGHYTIKVYDNEDKELGSQEVDVVADGSHPLTFTL